MFWLEEAGLPMTGANIARAMQLSPPTVHEMVGRLVDDGYVERNADKSLGFTDVRARARQPHRPPPPHDRALPHRRPRHPLGRGPRGGGADRARDVAGAGGADAGGDRRRDHLPARPPDRRGRRASRARCWPTSRSAPRSSSCASRTRPRSCCTTSRRPGWTRAWRGRSRAPTRSGVTIASADGTPRGQPQRRRDRLGPRRPGAAAARGDPRAAGALLRPLRPLSRLGPTGHRHVTIGAEVGALLPPRGSAVTITASTPLMSAIVVERGPARSGTKSAAHRLDFAFAPDPGLEDPVAAAAGGRWRAAGCRVAFADRPSPSRPGAWPATTCRRRRRRRAAAADRVAGDRGDDQRSGRRDRGRRQRADAERAQPAPAPLRRLAAVGALGRRRAPRASQPLRAARAAARAARRTPAAARRPAPASAARRGSARSRRGGAPARPPPRARGRRAGRPRARRASARGSISLMPVPPPARCGSSPARAASVPSPCPAAPQHLARSPTG